MGLLGVIFDDGADPGLKFRSPAVRDEIGELAPIFVEDDSITESKLRDYAVSKPKMRPGAVDSSIIAAKGVDKVNVADGAIGRDQLEDAAVTIDKAGVGVVVATDSAGNPVMATLVGLTAVEFGGLTPDPNTWYFTT